MKRHRRGGGVLLLMWCEPEGRAYGLCHRPQPHQGSKTDLWTRDHSSQVPPDWEGKEIHRSSREVMYGGQKQRVKNGWKQIELRFVSLSAYFSD